MMYTRASASDYDDWGMPGWETKSLLPLLNKSETYHLNHGQQAHGYDGPLQVSYGGHQSVLGDEWNSAAEIRGYSYKNDIQDLGECVNHTTRWGKWICPKTGRRSDPAHSFIHPVRARQQNLHLLLETTVNRVIFEGNRAVGIEVIPSKRYRPDADMTPKVYRARKQVVISAGTLSTPCILERSGIGNSAALKKFGIEVVSNVPGVGENYQVTRPNLSQ